MSKKNGNILAIGICFFLFAMISFVTGLQNPMGIIVKNQFEVSNAMSQLGNLANFIAYAFLGLPAGFILKRRGYKFTALAAVTVGFVGVAISFLSGVVGSFYVYLLGAFVSGFSMCMLNTVVNPLLNTLGGGGNKGNQLIQLAGSCNSLSATIVPVFVGYLVGDAAKASIQDANPALFIAMGVFALAFVILYFSAIPEPELEAAKATKEKEEGTLPLIKGALSYKHFVFGIIAIFLYVGIEVGIPNTVNLYLTTKTKEQLKETQKENVNIMNLAVNPSALTQDELDKLYTTYEVTEKTHEALVAKIYEEKSVKDKTPEALVEKLVKENKEAQKKIDNPDYQEGKGMDTSTAGAIVGFYWLLMLVGRLVGSAIGAKVSSRAMVATVTAVALAFLSLGILLPGTTISFPSVTPELSFEMVDLPLGVVLFILCGLCTSVMWGAIFNLAVEGLGKYTSVASGLFMVMVCGGGIVPFIQGAVADAAGFMTSFWVLVVAVAFILWYALLGSRIKKA
jgi:FHS family L-fucose permease-like MFS transporter